MIDLAEKVKPTSLEWLGDIPASWSFWPTKRIVSTKITDGPHETPELVEDGIPFISAEAVKGNRINFQRRRGYITQELHEVYSRKCKPQRHDIFIIKSGATTGNVAYVDTDLEFNIWSPLAVVRCNKRIANFKFVFYQMQSDVFRKQVELSWTFGTQENIGMGVLERIKIILPTLDEQQHIADYLDASCEAIDRAVEAKQKQLEALDALRKSIIQKAVTKGLDPSVPMKDSGHEWLGMIPVHWDVARIKRHSKMLRGKFTHRPRNDPSLYGGPYPFFQTGAIAQAEKYITEYKQTLNDAGLAVSRMFPKGTIVMSIAANIGDVAITDFEGCFPDSIVGFVPDHETDANFLYFQLKSMKDVMLRSAILTTQLNINYVRIGANECAFPPKEEQKQIGEFLDAKMAELKSIRSCLADQIAKLNAYRKSLIHECVTGKRRISKVDVQKVLAHV